MARSISLGILLTQIELQPSTRLSNRLCGDRYNCVATCPASALSESGGAEPYAINKYA